MLQRSRSERRFKEKGTILEGPELKSVLTHSSIGQILFEKARNFKNNICQIDATTDESETYSSVNLRSIRLALYLNKKELSSKDTIVVFSDNNMDNTIPIIASIYLGIKVANVDPLLPLPSLRRLFRLLEPSIVFVDEQSIVSVIECLREVSTNVEVVVFGHSRNHQSFINCIKPDKSENTFEPATVTQYETAIITVTGGISGTPKLICHSHQNFVALIHILCSSGVTAQSILHFSVSSWLSAMMILVCSFFSGGTRIFCHNTYDDGRTVLKTVERYKPELMIIVPAFTRNFESLKSGKRKSSLVKIVVTGTTFAQSQIRILTDIFRNVALIFIYGLSEVGLVSSFNPIQDESFMKTKSDSCGKAAPEVRIKVVKFDSEDSVNVEERGEIRVKSPGLMLGYHGFNCNACFDRDGYFKTGDVGYFDRDDCIYVIELMKDVFKCDNSYIIPYNIQSILLQHPAVKEAVVFGLTDKSKGEVPAAAVVVRSSVQKKEIEDFVAARVSEQEKLRGGVYIIQRLPKTPDGKIVKTEVKRVVSTTKK